MRAGVRSVGAGWGGFVCNSDIFLFSGKRRRNHVQWHQDVKYLFFVFVLFNLIHYEQNFVGDALIHLPAFLYIYYVGLIVF